MFAGVSFLQFPHPYKLVVSCTPLYCQRTRFLTGRHKISSTTCLGSVGGLCCEHWLVPPPLSEPPPKATLLLFPMPPRHTSRTKSGCGCNMRPHSVMSSPRSTMAGASHRTAFFTVRRFVFIFCDWVNRNLASDGRRTSVLSDLEMTPMFVLECV